MSEEEFEVNIKKKTINNNFILKSVRLLVDNHTDKDVPIKVTRKKDYLLIELLKEMN